MTLAPSTSIDKLLKDFDELMSTPIDFSSYVLNGLKIKNLTQEVLLGPAFRLLKGTHTIESILTDSKEYLKMVMEGQRWHSLAVSPTTTCVLSNGGVFGGESRGVDVEGQYVTGLWGGRGLEQGGTAVSSAGVGSGGDRGEWVGGGVGSSSVVDPHGFEGIFKDGDGDYSTLPKMENSSMNTSILSSISSWKMIVIQCWKVAGALNNPNGICLYAKVPYGQNFKKPGFLDSSSSLGGSTLEDFNRISEAFHSSGSTGSVLDFLMLKVTVSFPTLRKLEELRRKYSRKVLRGVNGSVLVSLEEDASSSKRFLPSMARDSF
ncbi:hypothetical protein Tco_1319369 [Tanacetum coccineum]